MISKDDINVLAKFVSETPPITHSRTSYRDPCKDPCKACEYESLRRQALEVVLKLQSQDPQA